MYLKNTSISVNIKSLVFTSHKNAQKTSQYNLDPTAVSGWLDGVEPRRSTTARLSGHGDFSEATFLNSRLVSFSGVAMAPDAGTLQNMRDTFVGTLGNGDYTEMSVTINGETRYATVGIEGKPSWVIINDKNAIWKMDLYAPDPFIYGAEKTVQTGESITIGGLDYALSYPLDYHTTGLNSTQTVKNNGNATAWPKFKVTGDYYRGFSIDNNLGDKVTYNGVVTLQAPVIIDMAKGTATQNGVDKTILMTKREWFPIHAQETIQPAFRPVDNGYGWCDIIFRDTYV